MIRLKTYSRKDKPATEAWYHLLESNKQTNARLSFDEKDASEDEHTWEETTVRIQCVSPVLFSSPLNCKNRCLNVRSRCLNKRKAVKKQLPKKRNNSPFKKKLSTIEKEFEKIEGIKLKIEKHFHTSATFLQEDFFEQSSIGVSNKSNSLKKKSPQNTGISKSKENTRRSSSVPRFFKRQSYTDDSENITPSKLKLSSETKMLAGVESKYDSVIQDSGLFCPFLSQKRLSHKAKMNNKSIAKYHCSTPINQISSPNISSSCNNEKKIINETNLMPRSESSSPRSFCPNEAQKVMPHIEILNMYFDDQMDAKSKILSLCNQNDVIEFNEAYDWKNIKNCCKIAEGSFGHVFMLKINKTRVIIKVIPVEDVHSHEEQPTYQELISEILISKCLSSLRNNEYNNTKNFSQFKRAQCVKGHLPEILLQSWAEFDRKQGEHGCLDSFPIEQTFVVLEMNHGGTDLSSFKVKKATELKSIFKQVAFSLAAAEKQFSFEHRDLHTENILIARTSQRFMKYHLDGKKVTFPSHGVMATIIDFTLSRLSTQTGVVYNDLNKDPCLFEGQGDYQYDVYRQMKKRVTSWSDYVPRNNIYWLHYLLIQLLTNLQCKSRADMAMKKYLEKLKKNVFDFASVYELVMTL